mgnify:CR=1 FL=1
MPRFPTPSHPARGAAPARSGRVAPWLLVGLVLIVGAGLWLRQRGETAAREALAPPRIEAPVAARPPVTERMAEIGDPTLRESRADETDPTAPSAPAAPLDFDGRGRLAGRATVAPGMSFPERWTLVIEPSLTITGRERAVRREVTLEGGETEFEVTDLPLGGYSLRATAPGLNGIPVDVAIFKGQERAYVVLRMTPSGFLEGDVLDGRGQPVEDLPVVLESDADKTRTEARTDANGYYRFAQVLDGEYTLYFGSPENPLTPPRSLAYQAPSLRFPRVELPVHNEITLVATDSALREVGGIDLRGFGSNGGTIEGRTGPDGRLRVRFLPPGEYRVTAFEDARQCGQTSFTLLDGQFREVQVDIDS